MKKKHNIYVIGIIMALVGGLMYMQQSAATPSLQSPSNNSVIPAIKAQILDVELTYPSAYATYQKANSPYTKTLNTVVWYENTEANKSFFTGGTGSPSEPPVTMSLDVYSNPNNVTAYQLLSADVPYLFARGVGGVSSLAGKPATVLEWDGLYKGKTVIVNNQGLMYVFSVTSITPSDAILKDFDLLLSSISFK